MVPRTLTNIFEFSHFFPTNFTSLSASEVTAKYNKGGK